MPEVLRILAGAAAVGLACAGLGRILWRSRPPSLTLACASGAAALSAVMFALLAAGLYRLPAIGVALAVPIAVGLWRIRMPELRRPPWWAIVTGAVFACIYVVHALAPEMQPDGAGYHLGLPAMWLRDGGFTGSIGFFELLPLGVETLYGAAMALGGPAAAKLIHLTFLILTIPLILQIARRLGLEESVGWAGGLLYCLAPVTGISGTSAYSDAALAFAHVALFALILEWKDSPSAWVAFHAGMIAGFCYSIKMTGAVAVATALIYMLSHRQIRSSAVFSAGAAVVALPWAVKAWWLTGNPLAPLGNTWFENDAFNAATEQALGSYLRDYDLASWTQIPGALLFDGAALQGLIGPVFILLPLALLACRKQAGRWLITAAAVSAMPWVLNIGARFLMPPLPFLALALASVMPARLLPPLLILHAALSLPVVMDRYAGMGAWRLRGWPWQVALRIESEADYLRKNYWEYNVARMVARHVKPGEPLLDLLGVPLLYSERTALGPLPTVDFDQMTDALIAAAEPLPERLYEGRYVNREGFLRGVRLRVNQPVKQGWSLSELRFERAGQRLAVSRYWFLSSWPVPQDAALAVDENIASRWHTYGPAKTGSHLEVLFDRPIAFDALSVISSSLAGAGSAIEAYGLTMDRRWVRLPASGDIAALPVRPLRAEASAFVKSRGVHWIVAPTHAAGFGPVGRSLRRMPQAWRVEPVEEVEGAWLFRIR